ncbi:MAG: hypothetical protein M1142_03040 [Patescibacteria group bacterium]|nr:hypothetical protein [Patescibacteria group bacterium]
MRKKLWVILVVGVILRILLSLTTFHSDIQVFDFAGKVVASGNILNLYDFSSNSAVLNYPPLIYLYHGIFNFLFSVLGLSGITQFNFHLLLLKLPYFIFDLLTGFIFLKLFDNPKKSLLAFLLWIFNPINLYATYMMGQFDIIPTFFVILSVYLVIKNNLNWAALVLGFGVAFKLSPIFLVIPLVVLGRNYQERFRLLILSMVPYLLSIIPYLFSHSFRSTALFANQSSKSLYANIPVSGGEVIILFPAFLLFFYLIIWRPNIKISIWKLFLIPLLLFFVFTHYHPQWLIWLTPLVILDLVTSRFKNFVSYLLIFVSWLVSLFFFDPTLTIGIFAPIWPSLQNSSSIWTILHLNPDYNFARSVLQTIFAASSLYLIYEYFPRKNDA